jgi:hypothetical protein
LIFKILLSYKKLFHNSNFFLQKFTHYHRFPSNINKIYHTRMHTNMKTHIHRNSISRQVKGEQNSHLMPKSCTQKSFLIIFISYDERDGPWNTGCNVSHLSQFFLQGREKEKKFKPFYRNTKRKQKRLNLWASIPHSIQR